MGRKTKKQKQRAKAKATQAQTPAAKPKAKSQMPSGAKKSLRVVNGPSTPQEDAAAKLQKLAETLRSAGTTLGDPRRRPSQMPQQQLRPEVGKFKKAKPSEYQQEQAVLRLQALQNFLHAKPKPILNQLEELGVRIVPFQASFGPDGIEQAMLIPMQDIARADAEIASRGTLYDQLYRGEDPSKITLPEPKKP
ncbi:hypothetical protein SEA_CANDLE_75 [Mycobacterium phage Candle]|uniref:Uncharacterized protein n=1 Tax=Mycobacterium phage Candle TaxID=2565513 RepID=A0A4D6TF47_9CAUD|nr:hypothetical protein SEA_CANDLE_75 [Mycobacterium phage Candle]